MVQIPLHLAENERLTGINLFSVPQNELGLCENTHP